MSTSYPPMAPIFVGGCARGLVERARKGLPAAESDAGVVAALVADLKPERRPDVFSTR